MAGREDRLARLFRGRRGRHFQADESGQSDADRPRLRRQLLLLHRAPPEIVGRPKRHLARAGRAAVLFLRRARRICACRWAAGWWGWRSPTTRSSCRASAIPPRAAYVFGAERFSLSPRVLKACDFVVKIPTRFSINVGMAGAIVLYDRLISAWAAMAPGRSRRAGRAQKCRRRIHGVRRLQSPATSRA